MKKYSIFFSDVLTYGYFIHISYLDKEGNIKSTRARIAGIIPYTTHSGERVLGRFTVN